MTTKILIFYTSAYSYFFQRLVLYCLGQAIDNDNTAHPSPGDRGQRACPCIVSPGPVTSWPWTNFPCSAGQPLMIKLFIFVFGTAVGSFLNVCIYRLPRSLSLIHPRSMCPRCGEGIAFYDNIPILSYLWLRGRCRHCGATISLRYPVVELAAGLFAVALFAREGLALHEGLILYVLVATLLVVTFIDIDYQIIPDAITYPGIVIGFLSSFVLKNITYKESLLGIAVGGGLLLLVASGYYFLTKKEGMGGGDVKLLAMIGAFLGWKAAIFTIMVGSAIGTVLGIAMAIRTQGGRSLAVPFGPFLSLGALLFIFEGQAMIAWYMGLMR
jgi:leader peptidase (prepilin peptidase)/N-methyltransferase